MRQLGELDKQHAAFEKLDTTLIAFHCECPPSGTERLAKRKQFHFHLANDDRLQVVSKYSVTSTYLIDKQGVVRARWLDRIHRRVGPVEILKALQKLKKPSHKIE